MILFRQKNTNMIKFGMQINLNEEHIFRATDSLKPAHEQEEKAALNKVNGSLKKIGLVFAKTLKTTFRLLIWAILWKITHSLKMLTRFPIGLLFVVAELSLYGYIIELTIGDWLFPHLDAFGEYMGWQ